MDELYNDNQGVNNEADTSSGNVSSYSNNQDYGNYSAPQVESFNAPEEKPVLAMVSMITGIASLVLTCCCGIFGLPLSITALVTGIICKVNNKPEQGKALAGIICGAVSIVIFIITLVVNTSLQTALQNLQ